MKKENAQINQFFRQVMNGLRLYLAKEFGLLHKDAQTINLARRSGIKPKGYYSLKGYRDNPKVLNVSVKLDPSFLGKLKATGTQEAMTLSACLPASSRLNVRRANDGLVSLEVPKPPELSYNLFHGYDTAPQEGVTVSLGIDTQGDETLHSFANPVASHLFVAGMTGSGKTEVLRLLIASLAQQNSPGDLRLVLADYGKAGLNFESFASIEHLLMPLVTTLEDTLKALLFMTNEIDRRKLLSKEQIDNLPRYLLVIDEVQEVFLTNPEAANLARKIVAMGREFKVNLILSTQYPNKEYLGDNQAIKNMSRIVGKADSVNSAYILSGVADSGAESLVGAGDFLAIDSGTVKRFQVALATPRTIRGLSRKPIEYLELPDFETADEEIDKRRRIITPDMLALAFNDGRYATLRENLNVGNAFAKKIIAFRDELKVELEKYDLVVTKKE